MGQIQLPSVETRPPDPFQFQGQGEFAARSHGQPPADDLREIHHQGGAAPERRTYEHRLQRRSDIFQSQGPLLLDPDAAPIGEAKADLALGEEQDAQIIAEAQPVLFKADFGVLEPQTTLVYHPGHAVKGKQEIGPHCQGAMGQDLPGHGRIEADGHHGAIRPSIFSQAPLESYPYE